MTIKELVEQCVQAINNRHQTIILVGKKTLFPKGGGPRPIHLLNQNPNTGLNTYQYDPKKVLAALVSHGLVELQDDTHA